ncbi:bacteriophage Mu DNA-binding protein, partial [Trabulsiella guamensis ATCC 49490]
MPNTEPGIRNRFETLVAGRSELRRKRAGTKAFEYHISVLPPEVRAELLASRGLIETSSGLITLPQEPSRIAADDLERQRLWS